MVKKPNILLITSDQHHWMAMGCNNPEIKTPNLDRLARSGMFFDRAYCPNPTCTPSRASIVTGMYPSQHGAYSLGTKLPEEVHTVGDSFHQGGYRTALIGKAHFQQGLDTPLYRSIESRPLMQDLNFWRGFNGPFYGFDHVELSRGHTDEHTVGQHYAVWLEDQGLAWQDYFRKPDGSGARKHKWNLPEEFHYNKWIAERSIAKLNEYHENGDKFFLWVSFPDPHPSYLVPEPWDTMYDPKKLTVPSLDENEDMSKMPPHFSRIHEDNPDFSEWEEPEGNFIHGFEPHVYDSEEKAKNMAVYYGMTSMMDKYIGTLLDELERLEMIEDTIVVFTTDHGHFLGQHNLTAKCVFHYEDLLKVPFIASCPGTIPENHRSGALISLVDLAPSFLSCCDITPPRCMTGINQKDVLYGNKDKVRNHVMVENRHQPTTMNIRTYIEDKYKLTIYYNRPYGELFDLENDPDELSNKWDDPDYKDIKHELMLKFTHAEMAKEPVLMPRVYGA